MKVYFGYVRGHADRHTPFKHQTLAQQLNVIADKLAQEVLVPSLVNERHIDSSFPFETIKIFDKTTKEKGIDKMRENLARWRSKMVARTYYASKKERARISRKKLDCCTANAWEGISKTSKDGIRC